MVVEKVKNCTSCGVCVVSCPTKCLTLQLNSDGFYRPILNATGKCISCGVCDSVCPTNISLEPINPKLSVSAKSIDKETLYSTSSGGVCYELAKKAIEVGNKVCACVYDYDKHRAKHVIIDNVAELEGTKGSKYFQSYTVDAFQNVFDGGEYIVFGTPCQIAGIDSYAKKKGVRKKLTLVDFFCHGTPSKNLWEKYLKENDKENIRKIDFRSKEFGWHAFSLKFTYNNGSLRSDYKENMFYNFFFNNFVLNDSCYECKYKALKAKSDIRVGDYWGEKFKQDNEGVSCCVAFTDKGKQKLKEILEFCSYQTAEIEDLLKAQMSKSPPLKRQREKVLKALKGKRKLKTINDTTLFIYRAKCKLKSLLKRG